MKPKTKDTTFIAIQGGGYYGNRCISLGFMTEGDSAVIEYKQFMQFINENEVTRPVFVSPYYTVCIAVARELNESARAIELEHELAEWVNNRA